MSKKMFDAFRKANEKVDGIEFEGATPKFWVGFGNYVINKIMTGRYKRGIPQGRITCLAGPSGAGKSFILGNAMLDAQRQGLAIVVFDSENAIDDEYLTAIGFDVTDENYLYVSVGGIEAAAKGLHGITKMYKEAKKEGKEMPNMLILVDSLDFLFVTSAIENYEKSGELSNDQGLQAKKWKQYLATAVQDIKHLNIAMAITKQVYVDQTQYAYPPWKMTESIKFAFSQTLLITKLFNKDKQTKEIDGIHLKVFGWKTRFTKPFQQCDIVVPYSTGLDPYEGLLKVAVSLNVVEQRGAWYYYGEEKFQGEKGFAKYKERILEDLIAIEDKFIEVEIEGEEDLSETETGADTKKRKTQKLSSLMKSAIEAETVSDD